MLGNPIKVCGPLSVLFILSCAAPKVPVPPPPGGVGWHTESQGYISSSASSSMSTTVSGNIQTTTYSSSWSQSAEGLRSRLPPDPGSQLAQLKHGDVVAGGLVAKRGGK